jgi:endonuclease/exonuclease/phosphatase family metal-dependent hydrolase
MNNERKRTLGSYPVQQRLKGVLVGSLVILAALSGIRFITLPDIWLIDLCAHFPVQYGLLAVVLCGICLWRRHLALGGVALLLAGVNLSVFISYRPHTAGFPPHNTTLRLYLANVWRFNTHLGTLSKEIERLNADCVFLMEVTPNHLPALQPLLNQFPVRLVHPMPDTTGFVFLSRHAVANSQIITSPEHGNRAILVAELQLPQTTLMLYGIHPKAPVWRPRFHKRNALFWWLAEQVRAKALPTIVVGDFNATPFSPAFQAFLDRSSLVDPRRQHGWHPSWPSYMPLCWLPIDHILVSSAFRVHHFSTTPSIGSDHAPVFAEVEVLLHQKREASSRDCRLSVLTNGVAPRRDEKLDRNMALVYKRRSE